MDPLVIILDTENEPIFISRNKLLAKFETQISTGLLPNICDANENLLGMLSIIKL